MVFKNPHFWQKRPEVGHPAETSRLKMPSFARPASPFGALSLRSGLLKAGSRTEVAPFLVSKPREADTELVGEFLARSVPQQASAVSLRQAQGRLFDCVVVRWRGGAPKFG